MRYAIVTDLHGDLAALRRVLVDVARERVDQVLCLGDVFECHIGKRDRADYAFGSVAEVFDQVPELVALLDGAVVVRGNQEERIASLVPDHALPAWSRAVLDAPLEHRTPFATYCHGHPLPWQQVEPGKWCPLDAEFAGRALVHGHHHRSAVHRLPRTGRAWRDVTTLPFRYGEPVPLTAGHRYLVNVGQVRGADPNWAVIDERAATVTYHRPAQQPTESA
ncbi:metallophosphoesterase family protein [Streptomyces sp. NPDC090442]|uniref:metallophosphoesterase family protein n=1 Tax=Streptomyces sp. NPDC090442 TaxID=3365962 RepID=UPI00380A8D55